MTTTIIKTFEVDYPVETVWASLTDPEKVVVCVPGASLTGKVDEDNYKGEVELKFGPVKAKYAGLVTFVERNSKNYKMTLKGSGTESRGKGGAEMKMDGSLAVKDSGTEVNIAMEMSVTGLLAQFGSRLIQDVANHVFTLFVKNFKDQLAGKEVDNTLSTGSVVGAVVKGIFGKNN